MSDQGRHMSSELRENNHVIIVDAVDRRLVLSIVFDRDNNPIGVLAGYEAGASFFCAYENDPPTRYDLIGAGFPIILSTVLEEVLADVHVPPRPAVTLSGTTYLLTEAERPIQEEGDHD